MKLAIDEIMQKGSKTSWGMAGLGLVFTGMGKAVGGNLGAGLMGFGLAHVILGLADIFKETAQN